MKKIVNLILLFVVCMPQLQAQVNLVPPSSSNTNAWILASSDREGGTFERERENEPRSPHVVYAELYPDWRCEGLTFAVRKTDIEFIPYSVFNSEYRQHTTTVLDFRDEHQYCSDIADFYDQRNVTYFIIEGTQVRVCKNIRISFLSSGTGDEPNPSDEERAFIRQRAREIEAQNIEAERQRIANLVVNFITAPVANSETFSATGSFELLVTWNSAVISEATVNIAFRNKTVDRTIETVNVANTGQYRFSSQRLSSMEYEVIITTPTAKDEVVFYLLDD